MCNVDYANVFLLPLQVSFLWHSDDQHCSPPPYCTVPAKVAVSRPIMDATENKPAPQEKQSD